MRISFAILTLVLVFGACDSRSGNATCAPAESTAKVGEAQLETTGSIEAWSLWFTTTPLGPNAPIRLADGEEVKVVWSVTGDGDFDIRAAHADGNVMEIDWGPDPHSGSNWEVPGDEWGTGWTFPEAGCWTFTVTRGTDVARLTVEVVS